MANFQDLLRSKQAASLLGDASKLEQLRNAPETQKIFSMLRQGTGGSLEQAADDAAKGNTGQLVAAIRQLMQDPEGAQLIEKMKKNLK